MNLLESFEPKNIDQQVGWLNEFLAEFLKANPDVKKSLDDYFGAHKANNYDQGVKRFNLERWCGGDMNPTVDIALVNGEMKFAASHYGMLNSLSRIDCNRVMVKKVIMDFFIQPWPFIDKRMNDP